MKNFRNYAFTASILVLLTCVGSAHSTAQVPPPPIARAWIDFWNSRDANRAAVLFSDNVFYEDVPLGAVNHGVMELQRFAQGYFSAAPPDARFDLVASQIRGQHGYIEWVWTVPTDTLFGTGKKFSVRGATVIDLVGDKIGRNSDYWDLATVFRQIGLLP
jgi:steroid delta-isomerase-like uncharacterized protein